jgi:hypothetical protein
MCSRKSRHHAITAGNVDYRKLSGVALLRTIRIRRGHESLDVTLAKGKDAESEEAQEHANSSSLALYA